MVELMGRTRPVQVPLPRGTASRVPQIDSLEEWGRQLKTGMVVAVRANASEQHLEGGFWLLLVESEAFPVPERLVHSGSDYEAGWLVVRGRWFELHQRSPRGYTLEKIPRLIIINTMIRLPNVIFSGGAVGKPPRESRSGLYIMSEDMVNLLLESV